MEEYERSVAEIVTRKLGDDNLPDQVAALILDAISEHAREAGSGEGERAVAPVRIYLKSIAVEGFRGIGPKATLFVTPGPGLTVVTGRNGSGKSSFAEAAELTLTGENKRWADRSAVWKEGWRNLHVPDPTAISVQLTEDGVPGTTTVTRAWTDKAALEGANDSVWAGATELSLAAKGWARPLELYRPFLSYAELGALVSGKPTSMHDAMQAILGLDLLTDTEKTLTDARRTADAESRAPKQELPALLATLATHPDDRARLVEEALEARTWDLPTLEALAVGDGAAADERGGLLRQVTSIALPSAEDVSTAVTRLSNARSAVAALAGTQAADARRLAGLLLAALEHQRAHVGEPCPVCGGRSLDEAWAAATASSVEDLTLQAADADAAHAEQAAALRALTEIVPPKPAVLRADFGGGLDPSDAGAAWDAWQASASTDSFGTLLGAVTLIQDAALQAIRQRDQAWQPVASHLAAWIRLAVKGQAATVRAKDLNKAIGWLRDTSKEVRNARLAPFARTSAEVWETLRQESNVELGPITLAGAGPMRKVSLDVTIDGVPSAALSVMSQGELHALGLALFLPRATAANSPFGFVVIDDPVQAMDPAKVDGLARVLSSVALSRQVVVFTHDDRLPAALRQLQLPATVLAVTRLERSIVTVRPASDPVKRYLEDARAMAKTDSLPEGVRAVAVAGLCRGAIEAACVDVARSRFLGAGVPHAEVERSLDRASHSVQDMVALALFGDTRRAGEVPGRLRELGGQGCMNAFWDAKTGVHDPGHGDLKRFIDETERLTRALRR
jgi:recombinational DNA repair ATPase RecF